MLALEFLTIKLSLFVSILRQEVTRCPNAEIIRGSYSVSFNYMHVNYIWYNIFQFDVSENI